MKMPNVVGVVQLTLIVRMGITKQNKPIDFIFKLGAPRFSCVGKPEA